MHQHGFKTALSLLTAAAVICPPTAAYAQQNNSYWGTPQVAVTIDPSLEQIGSFAVDGLIASTEAWHGVANTPTFTFSVGEVDGIGYFQGKQNQNSVRFARDGEPRAKGALAITVVTALTDNGRILDADIIVNGVYRFGRVRSESVDNNGGVVDEKGGRGSDESGESQASSKSDAIKHNEFDLQNVLTHEVGHVLGLKDVHDDDQATMYVYSSPGETIKRSVSSADRLALETTYANVELNEAGNAEPANVGCGGATIAGDDSGARRWALCAALGLGVVLVQRRRKLRAKTVGFVTAACLLPVLVTAPADAGGARITELQVSAKVAEVSSRWEQGFIVSELRLEDARCSAGACRGLPSKVEVLGGQVGGLVQHVGHSPTPKPGDRVALHAIVDHALSKIDIRAVQLKPSN